MESLAFVTVCSPERAPMAVCSAMWATRWALSAICFEVTSSSLMVVVISFIAVDCSLEPMLC
jgi:hypothetical protein